MGWTLPTAMFQNKIHVFFNVNISFSYLQFHKPANHFPVESMEYIAHLLSYTKYATTLIVWYRHVDTICTWFKNTIDSIYVRRMHWRLHGDYSGYLVHLYGHGLVSTSWIWFSIRRLISDVLCRFWPFIQKHFRLQCLRFWMVMIHNSQMNQFTESLDSPNFPRLNIPTTTFYGQIV